ncbi:MAG: S-adenosylmethionine:tRNA ribosyltransferase-isomerase [Candidatus Poriferisodalaceae bacterium]|jgi:S-adenosylmethionine:tRNA ribosyltransferase-isomerase
MDEFDYELPEEAIAQEAAEPRDSARLLVPGDESGPASHRRVSDLPSLLEPGDLVVMNETRVIPARLHLRKETGGQAEVLLLEPTGDGSWRALVRPGRRLSPGTVLRSDRDSRVEVIVGDVANPEADDGQRLVSVAVGGEPVIDVWAAEKLTLAGEAPLPPYIRTAASDPERYQTVYSRLPGSVAAPTAGLHLTPAIFDAFAAKGIETATVDLVVGLDTFRPVMVDDAADHKMHSEQYHVPAATLERCEAASRVVAIGTTTVRALESAARFGLRGRTELFLSRGSTFELVDVMMTNFHLPRSTLLLMIDAFIGPRWRTIYADALANNYRFLSFGDAMLLEKTVLPEKTVLS